MAYVDFSGTLPPAAHAAAPGAGVERAEPSRLSALEWSVVALARRDRLSSLARPGRMALALGKVFGSRPALSLADPRLEALRRAAVMTWHYGVAVPAAEIAAFISAGFTAGQYQTMAASIAAARAQQVSA
jgi:hypothetical protein